MDRSAQSESGAARGGRFATTRWSLVLAAGRPSSPDAAAALSSLCEKYWYPLYAFARRRGYSVHDAADLTQSFFATLLEKDSLRTADQQKGRFRSFLLTMFKRFLSKERDRNLARKRGGDRTILSFDVETAEARFRREPADAHTPERAFERQWATTLLARVLQKLEQEYIERDRGAVFSACRGSLVGAGVAGGYAQTAAALNMTEGAVKIAVHRMRQRYRELLKQEVADTVDSTQEIDEELRTLLAAVSRK
jgi:RNA polymerase sigma factor (sigma-70 family)